MRRNIFKVLGIAIVVLLIAVYFIYRKAGEDLPTGEKGPQATKLAEKMLAAVNKTAWDSTDIVGWSFRDEHHYIWNRKSNRFQLKWDDYEAYVDINNGSGQAFEEGNLLPNGENIELVQEAIELFNNDSFWLCAPMKIRDSGTERSYVTTKEGEEGLLVTYTSGGNTPGDSYLWLFDGDDLPKSVKMWVSIIPIGGVEFSWEDWITLPTGAMVAQNHEGSFIDIPLSNISSAKSLQEMELSEKEIKFLQ